MPPRVRLERPSARWRDAFLEAARRSRDLHGPWFSVPADASAFAAYARRRASDRSPGHLIVEVATGHLVGGVNLNEVVRGALQGAYVAYFAFAPFEGRGLMSEGVALAISDAFRRLRLHRLEANIQPGNARSIALVERLGFRFEGVALRYLKIGGRWRDHQRWALLAEDWRPSRLPRGGGSASLVRRHHTGPDANR